MAGSYRAIFWECVGDWEWIAQTFGFDVWKVYYLTVDICWRCMAATRGPFDYKNLSYEAACFSVRRRFEDYAAAVQPLPALAGLPGFDLQCSILWDWMHCSPLGLQHKSCGQCIMELVAEGRWGHFRGEWKVRTAVALKRAYADFTAWCRNVGHLRHSQQAFTPASLTVAEGADAVPHLKGKAHNLMCVSKWLAAITHEDNSTSHRRNRSRVMWSLALLDSVFASAPQWLSDNDVEQIRLAASVLFPAWRWLRDDSSETRWPIIPKMHAVMHIVQDALQNRRNPSGFWCFAGEHLMGVCKKSLGGQFQIHLDRRMLRCALLRLGMACR